MNYSKEKDGDANGSSTEFDAPKKKKKKKKKDRKPKNGYGIFHNASEPGVFHNASNFRNTRHGHYLYFLCFCSFQGNLPSDIRQLILLVAHPGPLVTHPKAKVICCIS